MSLTRPAAEIIFTRDEDGNWTGEVRSWGEISYVLDNIPAHDSAYKDTFETGKPWSNTTLRTARFEESPSAKRGILVLKYSDAPSTGGSGANPARTQGDDDPLYSIRESGLELPIREHPDYEAKWDHHILTVKDGAEWNWNTDQTKPEVDSGSRDENKIAHKDESWEREDGSGQEWYISTEAEKPGVDSFIVSGPQVVERRWFTSYNDAETFMQNHRRGTKATPAKTFGITDGEWLIWDSSVDPDGQRWEGQVVYQWADEWDADLYD